MKKNMENIITFFLLIPHKKNNTPKIKKDRYALDSCPNREIYMCQGLIANRNDDSSATDMENSVRFLNNKSTMWYVTQTEIIDNKTAGIRIGTVLNPNNATNGTTRNKYVDLRQSS